jgi:hypothetical protein
MNIIVFILIGGTTLKKITYLMLFIFVLFGCNEIDPSIESQNDTLAPIETPIETPIESNEDTVYVRPENYVGYANHISITETVMPQNQRLPEKYFTGTYSNIKYTALTKELCLNCTRAR